MRYELDVRVGVVSIIDTQNHRYNITIQGFYSKEDYVIIYINGTFDKEWKLPDYTNLKKICNILNNIEEGNKISEVDINYVFREIQLSKKPKSKKYLILQYPHLLKFGIVNLYMKESIKNLLTENPKLKLYLE